MSLEENFETLKGKVRDQRKRTHTETENPNFQNGFLEFVKKDEHEEDNSSQEVDNLIPAERSSNTVKKTKHEWVLRTTGP